MPRSAYKEVTLGVEADGNLVAVIVLESSDDKESLEKEPDQTDDKETTVYTRCLAARVVKRYVGCYVVPF